MPANRRHGSSATTCRARKALQRECLRENRGCQSDENGTGQMERCKRPVEKERDEHELDRVQEQEKPHLRVDAERPVGHEWRKQNGQ
jgi:hypothetical protein